MPESDHDPDALTKRKSMSILMTAVALWGAVIALGVFLAVKDRTWSILGALIVLACVATFLALWKLTDLMRQKRKEPEQETREP